MTRFFILIAVGLAGYLIYRLYLKQLLQQGKSGKIQIGLIIMGLLFIAMAAMLKAPAFFALIGAAMTQVMRVAPMIIKYAPWLAGSLGIDLPGMRPSTIKTSCLLFTMDRNSGKLGGTVLAGEFTGKNLEELSLEEIQRLLNSCASTDPEAVQLLQAYVARERKSSEGAGADQSSSSAVNAQDINLREARDILGLDSDAGEELILKAYRKLMRQLHPDKGGSNYLSAKVNAAKELLLKNSRNSKS